MQSLMQLEIIGKPILSGLRPAQVSTGAWEEVGLCPICGGRECREVARVQGRDLGVVSSVCLQCRLGFLSRRPSHDWTKAFYASEWDESGRRRRQVLRVADLEPDGRALRFCRDFLPERSRVLDVGAGFGTTLLAFQGAGHEVCAVEPSRHRSDFLCSELGLACTRELASVEQLDPPFQLICMQHVLEHVFDPVQTLRQLHRTLDSGGFLYLAVPELWQEYPPQSFHFVPHLSWFTVAALERLLRVTGFEPIKQVSGTEIQILARKSAPGALAPVSDVVTSNFWSGLTRFIRGAFGESSGNHLLVWYEDLSSRDCHYQREVLPGWRPAGEMIQGGIRILTHLPGRVRGPLTAWLPGWLKGHPRVMRVRLTVNGGSLPISLTYPAGQPPVWVK